jgi:glycerol uptake facilitator-like aquaporin
MSIQRCCPPTSVDATDRTSDALLVKALGDGGNTGLSLLANALATGGALVALILAFGPISGAHLNPAVTLVDAWQGGVAWRLVGTALANGTFGLPLFAASHHVRSGAPLLVSAFVATFGLPATIWGCVRSRPAAHIGSRRSPQPRSSHIFPRS